MKGHQPPDFTRNVVCVLGLPFDALDMTEAAGRVRSAAAAKKPMLLSTANLHFVIAARKDPGFRHSVVHSELSLADGMPIVWISRMLGLPIRERVPGAGLFEELFDAEPEPALKIYFFGAPDGIAEIASRRVNESEAGVHCVGYESPGFVSLDAMSSQKHIERINEADPDFLVVALGAQKGQAWIERNRQSLNAAVVSHLGAVVGFAAGSIKRAPRLLQRVGLEWLWRIKEEPVLWRRYATDAAVFSRLFVGCVMPLWWQRVMSARWPQTSPLTATVSEQGGVVQLKLGGRCEAEALEPLREALTEAAAAACEVSVDIGDVLTIDAAAMALLLLLHGHQRDIGQPLRFKGVSSWLRRQFNLHCAEFLLEAELRRPAESEAAEPRIA